MSIHSDLHYKTSFLEVLGLKKLLKNAKDRRKKIGSAMTGKYSPFYTLLINTILLIGLSFVTWCTVKMCLQEMQKKEVSYNTFTWFPKLMCILVLTILTLPNLRPNLKPQEKKHKEEEEEDVRKTVAETKREKHNIELLESNRHDRIRR